jgi:2,4-dienoyl-CoA reductase-like NADH-dependent reductase (Old Yellow Enzyme family)
LPDGRRKLTGAATISVGSVGLSGEFIGAFGGESSKPASLDNLIQRIEREEFDLIAVGRALLNDPAWVIKVRTGDTEALRDFSPAAMGELV